MSKSPAANAHRAVDPVCGKPLGHEAGQARSSEYRHRTYYFCSDACQRMFLQRTEKMRLLDLLKAGALLRKGGVRWAQA
jgi:YHS domain-containing protein